MLLLRCYPKVTDWIYEVSGQAHGADFRFLPIYSYGFWVAAGFFAAAVVAVWEMRRREKLGLMAGEDKEIIIGEPFNQIEFALHAFGGFAVFYKLVGIFFVDLEKLRTHAISFNDYIFSTSHGSIIGGLIGAVLMGAFYYYTNKKQQLPTPQKKTIKVYPSDNIGDLVVIAAVLGILGAVLFNFFETEGGIERFKQDPIGFLTSGLSVFGGLICAGIGFGIYAYKKKIHIGHLFDSVAPGYILANGIGRLGCHTAGDGDWGKMVTYTKPDWFPQFMWGERYAHNIINEGVPIPGCIEEHCNVLPFDVYPTPIYEFLMCTLICIILLSIRKKVTYMPGMIFTIFLILIGIQRFSIEQWRAMSDRNPIMLFGAAFKQSEVISMIMFAAGIVGTAYLYNYYKKKANPLA